MKKQFIVIAFECYNNDYKVLRYDTAEYAGGYDGGWYEISRISDDLTVLMVPMSRVFYVRLVEDEEET